MTMKISEIVQCLDAQVICGAEQLDKEVEYAFASDLMSDVLTVKKERMLLITGLANLQTLRTAEMSDIEVVLFVRNKAVTDEMLELARESGIVLIASPCTLFKVSGILYNHGLKPVY